MRVGKGEAAMAQAWNSEIIYQIYPKSFQDTNGDGVGDLRGIIQRLDYIHSLGVTAIWLNPIFQSPQVDNGYDVSDYYTIDPLFGDMETMEELIHSAHDRGLKVIFDMVLNHTSSQHKWFQEALKGRDNPYRDYYLWKDPKPDGSPPNNWSSFFGGSVWEKEPNGDQYYLHLFDKEMPDLNWENPKVREEMVDMARFWLSKGIDGLRLDAFIHMAKEPEYPDAPYAKPGELIQAEEYFANLPDIDMYLREFAHSIRQEFPDAYLLGEAASAIPERALDYTLPRGEACDSVVSFRYFPMKPVEKESVLPWGAQSEVLNKREFKKTMAEWQRIVGSASEPTLYWNNHDLGRAVSRFGDEAYREASSKMLATLMYLQKGTPVLLYGEEIGMRNVEFDALRPAVQVSLQKQVDQLRHWGISEKEAKKMAVAQNVIASRGAMQWEEETHAGFSTDRPWSGVNNDAAHTVSAQAIRPDSILSHYKKVLELKKTEVFMDGAYRLLVAPESVFAYLRWTDTQTALVVCNYQPNEETVMFDELAEEPHAVLLANGEHRLQDGKLTLSPYASVVFEWKKESKRKEE